VPKLVHDRLMAVSQTMRRHARSDRTPARIGAARRVPTPDRDSRPRLAEKRHRPGTQSFTLGRILSSRRRLEQPARRATSTSLAPVWARAPGGGRCPARPDPLRLSPTHLVTRCPHSREAGRRPDRLCPPLVTPRGQTAGASLNEQPFGRGRRTVVEASRRDEAASIRADLAIPGNASCLKGA
jgi:hypothetical protein